MLYLVPDIRKALREAWRVLAPRGVFVAATNGAHPYRELWEAGRQAALALGFSTADEESGMSERFNLENGSPFFPTTPEVLEWPGGFVFDDPEPAVRYMASGPLRPHIGDAMDDPESFERALAALRSHIAGEIDREGVFRVHSSSGCYRLAKSQES
jgi:SAM-dependent methyltransferase